MRGQLFQTVFSGKHSKLTGSVLKEEHAMSSKPIFLIVCMVIALMGSESMAQDTGAAAPPAPATIFDKLGLSKIKKKMQEKKDAKVNADGCSPDKETKPKLVKLSDEKNLESDNDLLKIAAKAKQDQDLAPQKIKALRYLSSLGCGCNADVEKAVLSGMEDCVPSVRAEAVKLVVASMQGSNLCAQCKQQGKGKCCGRVKQIISCDLCRGGGCRACNNQGSVAVQSGGECQACGGGAGGCGSCGTCCTPEIHAKLEKLARGQDASGCYVEPNPQIRALAEEALNLCTPQPVGIDDPDPEFPAPAPKNQDNIIIGSSNPSTGDLLAVSFGHGAYVSLGDQPATSSRFAAGTVREVTSGGLVLQFDRAYQFPVGSRLFVKSASGCDWRGEVVETTVGAAVVRLEMATGFSDTQPGERVEVGVLAQK
jgi:hypothetical protein